MSGFVDTYLNLNKKESALFMQEIQTLQSAERDAVMELTTSWKEEGRREGRAQGVQEGLREGLALAAQARFGDAGLALAERLASADATQLAAFQSRLLTATLEELQGLL